MPAKKTHGLCDSVEYKTFHQMHKRVKSNSIKYFNSYKKLGIKVCERWSGKDGLTNFLADMGKRPPGKYSIERRNGSLDYSPENCYWATPKQQQMNLRTTNKLGLRGVTKYWGVYQAKIRIENKMKYLGSFKTPMEAHEAFVQAYYLKNKIWPPENRDTPLCYKSPLTAKASLIKG